MTGAVELILTLAIIPGIGKADDVMTEKSTCVYPDSWFHGTT